MRLVLLGAPGSGKGTQAQKLVAKFSVPQISTGDLLRESVAAETEYGVLARDAMDAGNLVSDEIVLGIIRERLSQKDAAKGFILDGFPRNISQAQALDELLDDMEVPLDGAILMDVDYEALMQRLTGRRTCTSCGAVFNIYTSPAALDDRCDNCGGRLRHRADDIEDTINNRLRVYENHTRPVIAYYEFNGLLIHVDGTGDPDQVFKRVVEVVKPLRNRRRRRVVPAPLPPTPEPVAEPEKETAIEPVAEKAAPKQVVNKAAKKVAAKKVVAKKPAKKAAKKVAAKKVVAKKPAKKAAKKVATKKVVAKKAAKKKVSKKKVTTKKATGKKIAKKKAGATKSMKKVGRKKATGKKVVKKKTAKKKVAAKRRSASKKPVRKKTASKTVKKKPAKRPAAKKAAKKVTKKKTARKTPKKAVVKKRTSKPAARNVAGKKTKKRSKR